MPIYEFRDINTQETHSSTMSIQAKETYLAENPNLESYFTSAPKLGDAVRLGLKRPDDGFKEILARVIEKTPGASALNNQLSRSSKRSI